MNMSNLKGDVKRVIEYAVNANTLKRLNKREKRRIYLLLTPQYLNYGDHAIAYSELRFLQTAFPDREVFEVNYNIFELWSERLAEVVVPEDVIVVTGGGYMGNLWPEAQRLTERIVELFQENRIVFAPQTLFFKQKEAVQSDVERFVTLLKQHGNCFFFGRDAASCRMMESIGFVRDLDFQLMPDFAIFMPDDYSYRLSRSGVSCCLRDDGESVIDKEAVYRVLPYNQPRKLIMAKNHVEIPVNIRHTMLGRKFRQYCESELIVTDRLHAMIFSAYTGTPCVAFDNISGKVSGVYEWIRDLDYIAMADDVSMLPELAARLLGKTGHENRAKFFTVQQSLMKEYLPRFVAQIG